MQPKKDDNAQVFEEMSGIHRERNVHASSDVAQGSATTEPDEDNRNMTDNELRHELDSREQLMQTWQGKAAAETDQWRVYAEATERLKSGKPLRLCLQASAGIGKSFLLETIFLWAHLHGHNVKAAAPAGIAAARLRVARTPTAASTLRYLFGLPVEGESKIGPTKLGDPNGPAYSCNDSSHH